MFSTFHSAILSTPHATPADTSSSLLCHFVASTYPQEPHDTIPAAILPSPLLSLPAEIRNAIWSLLLLLSPATLSTRRRPSHDTLTTSLSPAILQTCKKVHAEATLMLYGANTFTASPTLLAGMPFLLSPMQPISCAAVSRRIRRWYINIRLDCDARFSESDVTAAFSGAEDLEVEATQAMFRAADNGVLMLFRGVRGVGRARVHGSLDVEVGAWLEGCMMSPIGTEVAPFENGEGEMRVVGGRREVYDPWLHGNR